MSRDTRHPNRIAAMPKGEKHWRYSAVPSVLTMHRRIHRKHGAASKHLCVDCGNQAKDWSLNGTIYTDNVEDYSPRCRSCHVKRDDKINDRAAKVSAGLKKAYKEGRRKNLSLTDDMV
jgi:NAD-dependent SIR2 family protein deacetylase